MNTHLRNRTIFRIYTEDKNRQKTVRLVSKYFLNFSIFYGQCVWHGKEESTVVFEIVDDFTNNTKEPDTLYPMIIELVQAIRKLNKQSDVLVTESLANITFVTGKGD